MVCVWWSPRCHFSSTGRERRSKTPRPHPAKRHLLCVPKKKMQNDHGQGSRGGERGGCIHDLAQNQLSIAIDVMVNTVRSTSFENVLYRPECIVQGVVHIERIGSFLVPISILRVDVSKSIVQTEAYELLPRHKPYCTALFLTSFINSTPHCLLPRD